MSKVREALSWIYQRLSGLRIRYKLLLIALVALLVFLLSKGSSPGQNHFVYLADAFLHGKLGVSGGGTGLAEIVPYHGNFYVVYPPMPAVLLLPFVALFGTSFDQGLMSVFLACLCVAATWFMLKKTGVNGNKAVWLTALFGFGTCFWFIASVGSSWYIEHVVAVLFLTLAIILALYQEKPFSYRFAFGLCILVAAASGSFFSVLSTLDL